MSISPFEPRGRMSLRRAAEEVIRSLEPEDGIGYAEAVERIAELTEISELEKADIMPAMLNASEELIADGEPGVENVRQYGWVRMNPNRLLRHAETRNRRGRRQFRRSANAAEATPPEALSWQDRQKRDRFILGVRLEAELFGRRAAKRRPRPEIEDGPDGGDES